VIEIFQGFEAEGVYFSGFVLVFSGILLVVVGLAAWVGGVLLSRPLALLVAGAGGGLAGYLLAGASIVAAIVGSILSIAVSLVFERIFISLLTAFLTAVIAFSVIGAPYFQAQENTFEMRRPAHNDKLSVSETVDEMVFYAKAVTAQVDGARVRMSWWKKLVICGLVMILTAAGLISRRFVPVVSWSVLGTVLVFGGMVFLLVYKGSRPVSAIAAGKSFYGTVFVGMCVFGAVVQSVLSGGRHKRRGQKTQKSKSEKGE